jgi:TP901 family phage tail tape measure protein
MASSRELALILTGRDQSASSTMDKVGDSAGGMARAIGAAGLVAGGALVAGLATATKGAADFQSQISGIAAVGGPEAVARMSEISAKALQVGKDTSFSASEAAAGMEELIKAGVSISDVLGGATDATVALAAATGVDLAVAAEVASNAMNQFGLAGEQLASIADIVAGAANASAIDVNDFKFSLASAGAVANTVGLSFQDTAIAIAELGKAGIVGSDAGTSLKTMLLNLQPTTKAQVAEFESLGLVTIDYAQATKLLTEGLSKTEAGQKLLAAAQKDGIVSAEELHKAAVKLGEPDVPFAKWAADAGLMGNAFFDSAGKVKPLVEIQGVLKEATKDLTEQQRLASLEILFGSDAIRAATVLAKNGV